jgi:transmembrane sensor
MDPWAAPETSDSVQEKAQAWYLRLVAGEVRREDVAALEDWLAESAEHQEAFDRARAIFGAAVRQPMAVAAKVERRSATRKRHAGMAAACMGAFLLIAWPTLSWLRSDYRSATGEIQRVALPDGTVAVLDTASAIDLDFNDKSRTVKLKSGRAWFQVGKDSRPFHVKAGAGEITDIGTAFSVRTLADDGLKVGVEDGIVDVAFGEFTQRLTKGGEGVFVSNEPAKVGNVAAGAFDWRRNRLSFNGSPLGEVLEEIDRYRPGIIYLADKSLADRRISAVFSVDQLEGGLTGLAANQHLRMLQVTPYLLIISSAD